MIYDYIIDTVLKIQSETLSTSLIDICKFYNIYIHYHDLGYELKGYYICYKNISNIVINQNLREEFINLVLGHELGHHFLHNLDNLDYTFFQDSLLFSGTQVETEANLFSAELLLPDTETLLTLFSTDNIYEAASFSNVPAWFMNYKIQLLRHKGFKIPYTYIPGNLSDNTAAY